MRTKLLIALAVVMAIVALTGFGGASVAAARADVPRIRPVPHPQPRPLAYFPRPPRPRVHFPDEPRPPVHIPDPYRPRVPIPPAESFEIAKQQRVRQLEQRYAREAAEVMVYACMAKQMWDQLHAETPEDAARQIILDAGGPLTFVPRVAFFVRDLKGQSDHDQIGEVAVFAFCEARG
jgi:hypothetical protein